MRCIIEDTCARDGKTIAKLLDEYNYDLFTMKSEFTAYLFRIGVSLRDFVVEENLKVDLPQSGNQFGDYGRFVRLLDEVKALNKIDAIERRRLDKEWRDNNDRHQMIEEQLNFLKDDTCAMKSKNMR